MNSADTVAARAERTGAQLERFPKVLMALGAAVVAFGFRVHVVRATEAAVGSGTNKTPPAAPDRAADQ